MSNETNQNLSHPADELSSLKSHWWFFAIVGAAMVVLGIIAIGSPLVISIVTVKLFGVLLFLGGVAQVVSAFWAGKWSGFFMHLLAGILYLVVGFLVTDNPMENLGILTALLAFFFMVTGIVKVIICLQERFCNWGWSLLNGVITVMLGMIIWSRWPESSLWVIGLLIGIEMLFNGWAWVMLGLTVRSIPDSDGEAA